MVSWFISGERTQNFVVPFAEILDLEAIISQHGQLAHFRRDNRKFVVVSPPLPFPTFPHCEKSLLITAPTKTLLQMIATLMPRIMMKM